MELYYVTDYIYCEGELVEIAKEMWTVDEIFNRIRISTENNRFVEIKVLHDGTIELYSEI